MRTTGFLASAAVVLVFGCSADDGKHHALDVGTGGGGQAAAMGGNGSGTGGTQGTGGVPSTGSAPGNGGNPSTGGSPGSGGAPSTGGTVAAGGSLSTGGTSSSGGTVAAGGTSNPGAGEAGHLVGMTDAVNAVRAGVVTSTPLPNMTWSTAIASVAQAYADQLASSGCNLVHSGNPSYGENLAWFGGQAAAASAVVALWASESACYTYGLFATTDSCQGCAGCGHYTQLVWRNTTQIGCGFAQCPGTQYSEVWVCNFSPPGNYVGQAPY